MMDNPRLSHLSRWRVCGVFSDDRETDMRALVAHILHRTGCDRVVYLHSETGEPRMPDADDVFRLQRMSGRHTELLTAVNAVTPETVLVMDDIETIQRYPVSMTRNMINHVANRTRYKIIGGSNLVTDHLYDLYAPFAVLDRRILWASHYWAFKAEHREVSVFDGHTVMDNKDLEYTAKKMKPFIAFDLVPDPDNALQEALYQALYDAPLQERVQDIEDLKI